jgi:hypothetical protein
VQLSSWLQDLTACKRPTPAAGVRRSRPQLSVLEDRSVPATLSVTSAADDGSAGTLRSVVALAHDGDAIVLKQGALSGITLSQGELILKPQNLTIKTQGNVIATISGNQNSRIFEINDGASVILRNLKLTDGVGLSQVDGGQHDLRGGAIVVDENATLNVINCSLIGNSTRNGDGLDDGSSVDNYGGAIANYSTLTVTDSILSGNSALAGGGIVDMPNSVAITVIRTEISGNAADADGGGIDNSGPDKNSPDDFSMGTLTVKDSNIDGNTAVRFGGGIHVNNSTASITGCSMSGNSATDGSGGGFYNGSAGTATIKGAVLDGNSAGFNGGGIDGSGILTLTNSILSNNTVVVGQFGFYGGGIDNWFGGKVTMNHDTVTGNHGKQGGGMNNFGTSTMTDCTFTANVADFGGGAIENSMTMDIYHSQFTGNSTTLSSFSSGGGIANTGTMTLGDSTISQNVARNNGGGLANYSHLAIVDCKVTGNTASNGGGMYDASYYFSTTVSTCIVTGNSANYGGGVYAAGDKMALSDSKFSNNSATYYGGGIDGNFSILSVNDCTVSKNTAGNGGGLYNLGAVSTLTDCKVSNNSATFTGGGFDDEFSKTSLSGCQVTGNSADQGGGIYEDSGVLTIADFSKVSTNSATTSGAGLYVANSDETVTVGNFSRVTGNSGPLADPDVYIAIPDDPTGIVVYLQGDSKLGSTFNGGILHEDGSSTIVQLDGNLPS